MAKDDVRNHFDEIAGDYDRWKGKSAYYYQLLAGIYRERVPEGASVLEIGCGTGTLLAALSPARGVGVDISPRMVEIAAAKHPALHFRIADAEVFDPGETFDFVIVPDVVEHLSDVGAMFRTARKACHAETRVIVTSVNPLWAPILCPPLTAVRQPSYSVGTIAAQTLISQIAGKTSGLLKEDITLRPELIVRGSCRERSPDSRAVPDRTSPLHG